MSFPWPQLDGNLWKCTTLKRNAHFRTVPSSKPEGQYAAPKLATRCLGRAGGLEIGFARLLFELRNAILIQSTSETALEPILKRFWHRKLTKHRSKIYQKSMSLFDFVFWSMFHSKICFPSQPRTSKINKTYLFFNLLATCSYCKLS